MKPLICLIATLSVCHGAALETDAVILQRARAANDGVYQSLQSFVCRERMDRFRGTISGDFGAPVDTITAKLSFERGTEQYSDVHQDGQLRSSLLSLPGAWSEGEFGSLLLETQKLLQTQSVVFETFEDIAGAQTARFFFNVSSENSPWDLEAAGHHYKVPFRTKVWIAAASGEIVRIERTSLDIASDTHISEIQWGITLAHVDLNGKQWLLPAAGTYAVLYQESSRRDWNVLNFTDYKRYGAETAVSFN